jgi:hypothetical protein
VPAWSNTSVVVVSSELDLLTGAGAGELLAAAVETAGGELLTWAPTQVDHRPGTGSTVSYRTTVRWGARDQAETLAATTALAHLPELSHDRPQPLLLERDDLRVAVWRYPLDPFLPHLPAACDSRSVAELLTSIGRPTAAADVVLDVPVYRPGRRAVVQVTTPAGTTFVKVVRPSQVEDLHRRHLLLHEAGVPVPASLGWSAGGLLVLEALTGTAMRDRLLSGAPVPAGERLLALLDLLPAAVTALPRRPSWSEGAQHYAAVVAAALPDQSGRVRLLADDVATGLAGLAPDAATHGDFHDAQVLLSGATVSGLLDVDTAGPGRRADDLACVLGHALALDGIGARDPRTLHATVSAWQDDFEQVVDAGELRLRTAGVLLSLATGPYRVQEPGWQDSTRRRLDLAEEWVRAASALRGPRPGSALR